MHTSFDPALQATPGGPVPLRVLLAEDEELHRLLACALLSRWGIRPALAIHGLAAVRLARRRTFDLILMDVDMPVMNGVAATARIRRLEPVDATPPNVPVVAYTGGPFPSDAEQLRLSGMDAVLAKPCTSGEMAACLRRHCPERFAEAG